MHTKSNWLQKVSQSYKEASQQPFIALGLCLLSFPFQLLVLIRYLLKSQPFEKRTVEHEIKSEFEESGAATSLKDKLRAQEKRKVAFLKQQSSQAQMEKRATNFIEWVTRKKYRNAWKLITKSQTASSRVS